MNHINLKSEKFFILLKFALPVLAGAFLFYVFITAVLASHHAAFQNGKSAGIKETKELYQKDLIDRNLAVYDELTGKWTMPDSGQIVNNLIKYKKIDINKFVPPSVSGVKECFCAPDKNNSSNNTISTDELFNGIENLDLENITGLDKKLVAKNPVKKKR